MNKLYGNIASINDKMKSLGVLRKLSTFNLASLYLYFAKLADKLGLRFNSLIHTTTINFRFVRLASNSDGLSGSTQIFR